MGTSDKFCLRWDSRWDTFARIQDYDQFFDCTLTTDDDEAYSVNLRAHKVILSACSDFFGNILTRESMCANPNPLIYIRGISTQDIKNILHFIYNGEVNVARNEVDHFLEVAESLKIKGLMKGPIGTLGKPPENDKINSGTTPSPSISKTEESLQTESGPSEPLCIEDFEASVMDVIINEDDGEEFEAEIKEGRDEPASVPDGDVSGALNTTHSEPTLLGTLLVERLQAVKSSSSVLTHEHILSESSAACEVSDTTNAKASQPYTRSPTTKETNNKLKDAIFNELFDVDANNMNNEVMNEKLNEGNIEETDEKDEGVGGRSQMKGMHNVSGSTMSLQHETFFREKKDLKCQENSAHSEEKVSSECNLTISTSKNLTSNLQNIHPKSGTTEVSEAKNEEMRKENNQGKRDCFVRKTDGYYHCDQCPKFSNNKATLKAHIEAHSEEKVSPECNLTNSTSKKLTSNLQNVDPKSGPTEVSQAKNEEMRKENDQGERDPFVRKTDGYYHCDQCPQFSYNKAILRAHIEAVHDKIKKHVCKECGYAAKWKNSLKLHIESVHLGEKKFECELCPYKSARRGHLKAHIDQRHEKTGNYVCEDCGYIASLNSKLKLHMVSVHKKGNKIFKCDQCPYATTSKGSLKVHVDGVHNKIRNHVCEECGFATTQNGSLNKHKQSVHKIGDKQFKCERCPLTSFNKDVIKRHFIIVHEKKNFICEDCGFAASFKTDLNRHRVSVHKIGDKKFKCEDCDYAAYRKVHLKQHRGFCKGKKNKLKWDNDV